MNITLYQVSDENNRVAKSLHNGIDVSGYARGEVSITSPVIQIESTANLSSYNYCYIAEFRRYFYIVAMTHIRNGLYELTLKCDVLMSFANDFMGETGVILRQENEANLYLPDTKFPIEARKEQYFKQFESGFDLGFTYYLAIGG